MTRVRPDRGATPGPTSLAPRLRSRHSAMMAAEIELVALTLFEEQGFLSVTVDDIATAARISARTFYRYFATKEDVFQLQIERRSQALQRALAARHSDESPIRSLRLAYVEVVEQEDTTLARRWVAVVADTPSVLKAIMGGIHLNGYRVMAEFFADRLGVPADDLVPAMLAAASGGVIQAAHSRWLLQGQDLATTLSAGFDVLERGVGSAVPTRNTRGRQRRSGR